MAHDLDRDLAEHVVLAVRQCLARRDDDALAGVDPHRIEVLHVADGDAVVEAVADDLVLDLLPAFQILLDQHLAAVGQRLVRALARAPLRSRHSPEPSPPSA